jgi:hypothetical protein
MANKEQVLYSEQDPGALADLVTTSVIVSGGTAAATTKIGEARDIVAVFAIVKASGAFATKALLAKTTDYTFNPSTHKLTYVTDQSANYLHVIYR